MPNHFHLVVETPQSHLVAGMKWFLGTYTSRFNRRHRLCGHLFSGRYQALVVDGSGIGYLRTVGDYVHLNRVRAGLLTEEQPLSDYAWSRYPAYLRAPSQRPGWLRVDRLPGECGIRRDDAAGRPASAVPRERAPAQHAGWWPGPQGTGEFPSLAASGHRRVLAHVSSAGGRRPPSRAGWPAACSRPTGPSPSP